MNRRAMTRPARARVVVVVVALAMGSIACPQGPAPPAAPTVDFDGLTNIAQQVLRGTKPASTAIDINDAEAVALDESTTWTAAVNLDEGTNAFGIEARDKLGRKSSVLPISILLDTVPPDPLFVDGPPPPSTLHDNVTIRGQTNPSDRIIVNGQVSPTPPGARFTIGEQVAVGVNEFKLASLDLADNESLPVDVLVTRLTAVPFTVDVIAPTTTVEPTVTVTGTRGPNVVVTVNGTVLASDAVGGVWQVDVPLPVVGANPITARGELLREADSFIDAAPQTVTRTADITPPVVAIAGITDPARDQVVVTGTATDDAAGLVVEVCANACTVRQPVTPDGAGAFSVTASLAALDPAVLAVAFVDVHIIGTDASANVTDVARTVTRANAPLAVGGAGAVTAVDAAGPAAGPAVLDYAAAWIEGGTVALAVDDGAAIAPTVTGAFGASAAAPAASVAVARSAGGIASAAWANDAVTQGVAFRTDGGAEESVVAGVVATDVDVAFLSDGVPAVAWVEPGGNAVRIAVQTGPGAWSAPIDVADALTTAPAHVQLAAATAGAVVTVAWQEVSDRDGAADDVDIVARRLAPEAGPPPDPVLLVSESGGAFVDAASSLPCVAALAGAGSPVAVAWVDGGRGVVSVLVDADFTSGTPPVPDEATSDVAGTGTVTGLALGADGGALAVAWLDDGAALLAGAAAPGLVARRGAPGALGAAVVLSTAAASSPSLALRSPVGEAVWIEAGRVRVWPVVLP